MIETADEILSALQADPLFSGLLGTFVFEDASEVPAIAILASNEQLPSLDRIEGIECVIMRTPNTSSRPLLSGGCPILSKAWRLYLVEYQGAGPNDLIEAADRICNLYPGASYAVSSTLDVSQLAGLQQVVLRIPGHAELAA